MPEPSAPEPELHGLDPELDRALRALGPVDREALLLVAWEDLTPTQAAHVLKLNPTAFRVRLLRARRRLRAALEEDRRPASLVHIDVEGT
jgi:RNA polymerase sigma-70 factor (ECF subfamily)